MAIASTRVIELTLTPNFLSWMKWTTEDAVKELIRNAVAARDPDHARVEFSPPTSLLQITNIGDTIPAKALLTGYSSRKTGFGEGMKLAYLTLVQAGHRVTVFNGAEKWMPHVDRSEFFDENVLKILVSRNATLADGVSIWIDGVDSKLGRFALESFSHEKAIRSIGRA